MERQDEKGEIMCSEYSKKLHLFVALFLLVSLSASFAQVSAPGPMYKISESRLLRLLWIETRSGEIYAELQKARDLSIEQLKSLQLELQALRVELSKLKEELSELKVKSADLEKSSSEVAQASEKSENSLKKLEESFDSYMKTAELKIKKLSKAVFMYKALLFVASSLAVGIAAHDLIEEF